VLGNCLSQKKKKKDDKISQQEVVLKKQTVELEKKALCLTLGAKEIKITFN
jgi:hypothetical protein